MISHVKIALIPNSYTITLLLYSKSAVPTFCSPQDHNIPTNLLDIMSALNTRPSRSGGLYQIDGPAGLSTAQKACADDILALAHEANGGAIPIAPADIGAMRERIGSGCSVDGIQTIRSSIPIESPLARKDIQVSLSGPCVSTTPPQRSVSYHDPHNN